MSLLATLSSMVLTGAATPVSITEYQTGGSTRTWHTLNPPVDAVLVGHAVDVQPGAAASTARGVLYTRLPGGEYIRRVEVQTAPGRSRVYDVDAQRTVDGVLALTLSALWEDGA